MILRVELKLSSVWHCFRSKLEAMRDSHLSVFKMDYTFILIVEVLGNNKNSSVHGSSLPPSAVDRLQKESQTIFVQKIAISDNSVHILK